MGGKIVIMCLTLESGDLLIPTSSCGMCDLYKHVPLIKPPVPVVMPLHTANDC